MPGLVAERVSDVGQTDVFVPFQARVETTVVGPFAHGFGLGALAIPLQIHAAPGAVGVAGDQVMLELIRPDGAVLVLRLNQVAIGVVLVGAELTQRFAVNDLPKADKPAVIVDHRAEVQMDFGVVVFLIGDQVGEHRVFAVTMLVMQHHSGAVAQRNVTQHKALATADVGFLAFETTAQQQLIFAFADQGDVFNGVVVEQADLWQWVAVVAAVSAVER
ncbi:hypothetical protein PS941_05974 [Pseudomonas fluorescens]|uniref:Uncharacterized protein n=1 Tax=Pseudomonas fluorescens TaxID=294 RepID=A0A5E7VRZ1_PSEFL|nr:hypothetical protein PS941_05974 [Pseudomonas fluorescens]